jgi:hypothetical protein
MTVRRVLPPSSVKVDVTSDPLSGYGAKISVNTSRSGREISL